MLISESTLRRIIREEAHRAMREQAATRTISGAIKVGQGIPLGMPGTPINAGNWTIPVSLADRMRNDPTFLQVHAGAGAGQGQVTLKTGSKGTAVSIYQELLQLAMNASGIPLPKGFKVDGDYGPNTQKATIAFQNAASLPVDGVVGRNVIAALIGKQAAITGKTGIDTAPVQSTLQVQAPNTPIGQDQTARDVNTVMNLLARSVQTAIDQYQDTTNGRNIFDQKMLFARDNLRFAVLLANAAQTARSVGTVATRSELSMIIQKLTEIKVLFANHLGVPATGDITKGEDSAVEMTSGSNPEASRFIYIVNNPTADSLLILAKKPYALGGGTMVGVAGAMTSQSARKTYLANQASVK